MATLKLRAAREDDVLPLRAKDIEAIEVQGFVVEEAIAHSVRLSTEAYLVSLDDEPVAAWGYGSNSLVGERAYGWLLTSPKCDEHTLRFLRMSREWVGYILARFPILQVQVQKSHEKSIMWLAWLGFIPVGEDAEFFTLEKVRECRS